MSLLKTKPRWCSGVEATEHGWVNSLTGELLVSIRGLKSKLTEETVMIEKQEPKKEEVVKLKEQTIKKPKRNQKIIAEVVEYNLSDKEIVGE